MATKAKDPFCTFCLLPGLVRQVAVPHCDKKETQGQRGQGLNQEFRANDEAELDPSLSCSRT